METEVPAERRTQRYHRTCTTTSPLPAARAR